MDDPVHTLAIAELPTHPLTKLEFILPPGVTLEQFTQETLNICVLGTNELVGTIPATTDLQHVRLQDIDRTCHTSKRCKIEHQRADKETLQILEASTMKMKPAYTQPPFPHGTSTIEELALVGAEKFETVMQLYNHWFGTVPLTHRIQRELSSLDPNKISLNDLKLVEALLHNKWKAIHSILMKRSRGTSSVR